MVLDEKMLSLINRIGDERMESLTTGDFLVINAMYHAEQKPLKSQTGVWRRVDISAATDMFWCAAYMPQLENPVYIRGSLVWIVKQTRNCY